MENPVLVEMTRGGIVESRHRGSFVVVDGKGTIHSSIGDFEKRIFPRSAIKGLQAFASFETGAIDKFDLTNEEIALACASHSGEVAHVTTAQNVLNKAGLSADDLECGSHWPLREEDVHQLAATQGQPCGLHNNCSGKHASMLASAVAQDIDVRGYVKPEHGVQQRVRRVFETFCGLDLGEAPMGTDGCSVPTWAIPQEQLAYGFARFGSGQGLDPEQVKLCERIRTAVAAAPFMVAGTDRFCTRVMEMTGKSAFLKVGAEGVYCAALPELGLGVALKIDDGAKRAAEVVMAHILQSLKVIDGESHPTFAAELTVPILNRNKIKTGVFQAAEPLLGLSK